MPNTLPTIPDSLKSCFEQGRVRHVAIIMDGNRRWAKSRGLPTLLGHQQGVESLKTLVRHTNALGLSLLTVYAFSTENWHRPPEEVDALLTLFMQALIAELPEMQAEQVRLRFIGAMAAFSAPLQAMITEATDSTAGNTGLTLQVALNYGSRAELVQVARTLAEQVRDGTLDPEAIDEACFAEGLNTANQPDPDLMIRTGGDERLSNYLLWQCAYAELCFLPVLWPDFSPAEFDAAVWACLKRDRRFGT